MDATIVVLIDHESRCIRLFGEFNKTIAFDDAFVLPVFLSGKTVINIIHGEESQGDDVITYINDIPLEKEPERRYLHSKVEGYIKAPDVKITFSGKRDSKPLDKYGYDIFTRSKDLAQLLRTDQIELIPESEALRLKKQRPTDKAKDKALDSIILTTSVQAKLDQEDEMFSENNDWTDDLEKKEELSDAEQMIRKGFGKKDA